MNIEISSHASKLTPEGETTKPFRPEPDRETELKIQLGGDAEERLRQELANSPLCEGPVETRNLVSVYHDTPKFALAGAGIALRLRKVGDDWVQTVKKRPQGQEGRGLFAAVEHERPAPEGALLLDDGEAPELMAEIRALVGGEAIAPVFETRVKRDIARLRTEKGRVELAIDRGEVIAGALFAPIREAEIELLEGEVGAVFEAARTLFVAGPLRFSEEPKAARGMRLAQTGRADLPRMPRPAGAADYSRKASVEEAAQAILRDCHAQISDNLALVVEGSTNPEAVHQLRVGLRRLRSAILAFRDALGREAFAETGEAARRIGNAVGELRDLDVLIGEIIPRAGARGLGEELQASLVAALGKRREQVRDEVRAMLAGAEATRFVLDLGELIETRAWRQAEGDPDAKMAKLAPVMLDARYRKVAKRGRELASLDIEGLHELRKDVKKLRYVVDLTKPVFGSKRQGKFLKAMRKLQERFGDLNDEATAGELLAEVGADPRTERAAGWLLGALAAGGATVREDLAPAWKKFASLTPYWR